MEELFARDDFAQRFELISSLGSGSTVVYLANDKSRNQKVVLKFIDAPKDADQRHASLKAVRESLRIHSECVVRTYEVISADSCICLVMEYIVGKTLAELVTPGIALPFDELTKILKSVTRGLSDIHRSGLVHRDLKLDNVMVSESGVVKIVDLGLMSPTQIVERAPDAGTWIHTADWIVGTPAILPPEYYRRGEFDRRSDLYALGCMAYELITGTSPFPQKTFLGLVNVKLKNLYPSLLKVCDDCPPYFAGWVTRLLETDPKLRFQNCAEALEGLSNGATSPSCVVSIVPLPPFPVRRELERLLSKFDRYDWAKGFVRWGEELLAMPDDVLRRAALSVTISLVVCGLMSLSAIWWVISSDLQAFPIVERNVSAVNSPLHGADEFESVCGASLYPGISRQRVERLGMIDGLGQGCALLDGRRLSLVEIEPAGQDFALFKSRWPKQEICRVDTPPSVESCIVSGLAEIDLPVSDGASGVYFVIREQSDGVPRKRAEVWHHGPRGRTQITSLHRPISALVAAPSGEGVFFTSPNPEGAAVVLFYSSAVGEEVALAELDSQPRRLVLIDKQ